VDDVSVLLEHVDLLNCLDRLNIKLLQRCLELLVVHSLTLVDLLDLSSWCTLSTIFQLVSNPNSMPLRAIPASPSIVLDSNFAQRELCTYPKRMC
jgi:hypothetical protein